MASAPSVSNFPWPYGWSSSGSFAATRTTIRASTLLSASTHESTAPPSTAREPDESPTASLTPTTARLATRRPIRSEEHTSELQSRLHLVCRLLLEKKKKTQPKGPDIHIWHHKSA